MSSPDPQPTDDIAAIATRYGLVAKQVVNDTVTVATDAFGKINTPNSKFDASEAIKSMGRLVNIALTGGLSFARVAFEINPDPRVLLVADNIADSVSSAVSDVIDVAKDAAVQVSSLDAKATKEESVNWAIRLTSIAALRGAEVLETAVAGPGNYGKTVSTYTLDFAPKPDAEVTLSAVSLARPGDPNDIAALVVFPTPTAPKNAVNFTIKINTVGLPSAQYLLMVRLTRSNNSSTDQAFQISIPDPSP